MKTFLVIIIILFLDDGGIVERNECWIKLNLYVEFFFNDIERKATFQLTLILQTDIETVGILINLFGF